jgi:bis(5'-nucleosyl)-tetraphosphatase (symmetrical)
MDKPSTDDTNSIPGLFSRQYRLFGTHADDSKKRLRPLACSAITSDATTANGAVSENNNLRLRQTPADKYFAKHQRLPLPSVMHAVLPVEEATGSSKTKNSSILVVGDVHGCMEELQALHEKAIQEHNGGSPFSFVILVGDLCNKGPQSAEVVRWARTTPNVWSVRGNHDDAALAAALGDAKRRSKKKYQWALKGEESKKNDDSNEQIVLSDEDVIWLSELPYTLTIPGSYLGQEDDTLIVHAGLIPEQPLEDQTILTMITIREVLPICDALSSSPNSAIRFEYNERQKGNPARESAEVTCNVPMPWALAWKGPQHVIFGHDARRGLQRYPGDLAIGLDTGAVYGKHLTAMILPTKTIVSVPSSGYSPVDKGD